MMADDPSTPAADQPEDDRESSHASEGGSNHGIRRPRDWGHIPRTRIRTSTALVTVLFVVSVILYGYSSQRYGVVSPAPEPVRRPTTATYSPTPSLSPTSVESVSPTESVAPTGENDDTQPSGEEQSPSPQTIPGLPGVTVPRLGTTQQQTQTTPPVPTP
ncbi:hypothetical protein [Gordonia sp. NPDC003429]